MLQYVVGMRFILRCSTPKRFFKATNRHIAEPKNDKFPNGSLSPGIQAKFDMVWLGWPGADFNDAEKDIVANEAMKQGKMFNRTISLLEVQWS